MEQQNNVFIEGMMWKAPHENAPDFIRGCISVKVDEFIKFAQEHQKNGWLNIDVKKSKAGKIYLALNTYTKKSTEKEDLEYDRNADEEAISIKDIPF